MPRASSWINRTCRSSGTVRQDCPVLRLQFAPHRCPIATIVSQLPSKCNGADLAKRIRGYTNDGAELVSLLVNALENKNPEVDSKGAETPYPKLERQRKGKPAEGFTASQRVWAACELLRRAYDIRTDHITPADIQAYRNAQTPAANKDADSSPGINRTGITPKDIQAETPAIARASKATANANNRAKSAAKATSGSAANRDKSEKRKAATAEQPDAAKNIAATEKPDAPNTPSANPGNPGRAARRRQKRAARKAQKRKAAANNHANGKPRGNGSANTPAANEKNGKPQAIHATNGKTPEGAAAIILDSEPLSIEEWKRLRKTLAHQDNIPANARSP